MTLTIDLLGAPTVSIGDRAARPPRGRKTWGLLAYLLLTPRPVPRERLAQLLFDEAADPLGALRWNLAELRRTLGPEVGIGGEPLRLELPEDAAVDVRILSHGTWVAAARLPGLGRELLEGIGFSGSAAFETWLLAERRRFAGISASILREAATARLASGDAAAAVELASRLVAIEDFDEEAHALLIRAYMAAGDATRARQQSARSATYLRDELGLEPSATLVRALAEDHIDRPGSLARPRAQGDRSVETLVEAGRAAFDAGATEAGIETLRRAVGEAESRSGARLRARAWLALGTALVHVGRGRDGEGATALHAALAAAEEAGDARITSEASRELGYIEFLRARYDRAETWLGRAMEVAPDDLERGSALGVLGAVTSDRGRTEEAIGSLEEAARIGGRAQKARVEGWSRAFLGRARLLRGELAEAHDQLERALVICRSAAWLSFEPFVQTLLGDVHLQRHELDAAGDLFEVAYATGCRIGDPCWEGLGARGIGLVHLANGRIDEGFEWLEDAKVRCVRVSDAYLWIHAYCLDALGSMGSLHRHANAATWVAELGSLAARTGMREMLVRSQLHRAALGDEAEIEAARLFARDIDNPAVLAEVGSPPAGSEAAPPRGASVATAGGPRPGASV